LIFEDDQKLVDAKRKIKRKLKIFTKNNKRSNLDHLFSGNSARKRGLLTMYMRIQLHLDLQADKSSVIAKEPFSPQV
jgi:hypothetical protein